MVEFKVTINTKHDHLLYSNKIVNVSSGKEFNNIRDAIKDINNGVSMLLHYLGIEFHIEDKGSIEMEKLDCFRESIQSIYSHLSYLSTIQCELGTYIMLREFIDDICQNNNENMINILTSLVNIHDSNTNSH